MKKWVVVIMVVFLGAIAYRAGQRLGGELSAVVIGVLVGIAVSLPLQVILFLIMSGREVRDVSSPSPPTVVYTAPTLRLEEPRVVGAETARWNRGMPLTWIHRDFHALNGEPIEE